MLLALLFLETYGFVYGMADASCSLLLGYAGCLLLLCLVYGRSKGGSERIAVLGVAGDGHGGRGCARRRWWGREGEKREEEMRRAKR